MVLQIRKSHEFRNRIARFTEVFEFLRVSTCVIRTLLNCNLCLWLIETFNREGQRRGGECTICHHRANLPLKAAERERDLPHVRLAVAEPGRHFLPRDSEGDDDPVHHDGGGGGSRLAPRLFAVVTGGAAEAAGRGAAESRRSRREQLPAGACRVARGAGSMFCLTAI